MRDEAVRIPVFEGHIVGRRMKCAGMRWSVDGANPVLWLRCARLGGWFDDYWNDRLAA